jgi:hypothetical protein
MDFPQEIASVFSAARDRPSHQRAVVHVEMVLRQDRLMVSA